MRVVVALGGNAILRRGERGTIAEQRTAIRDACDELALLVADGHELLVTHGNGPQVGRLMLQDEAMPERLPRYPLDVHVAETQGQLGYLLAQELAAALRRAEAQREVVAVVTQVEVDPADPAFEAPTKPVGPYLSKKGAAEYLARGITVREVPGGGWRRVVASPGPIAIVEAAALRALLEAAVVPIAAGGGGVPVVREGNATRGVPAVIDKDLSAAVLARDVAADALLILTDVDGVYRDFGANHETLIRTITVAEAEAGVADGTYPRGSMGEKLLAATEVAKAGGLAVIAGRASARDALAGRAGTTIVGSGDGGPGAEDGPGA